MLRRLKGEKGAVGLVFMVIICWDYGCFRLYIDMSLAGGRLMRVVTIGLASVTLGGEERKERNFGHT